MNRAYASVTNKGSIITSTIPSAVPTSAVPSTIGAVNSKPLPSSNYVSENSVSTNLTNSEKKMNPDSKYDLGKQLRERWNETRRKVSGSKIIFDIPITYNKRVSYWISYFQGKGKTWFKDWLQRSYRYMPFIQQELKKENIPQDLAYMVMIESGFEPNALSAAAAVGPWQFIQPTGERYGLNVRWWIDERKDLKKSTLAAIKYIKDLYNEFGSWYLVAASYNMGENGLRRQIQKYRTKDFWYLSKAGALPQETTDYVPKILAAMMISKSPSLYGFRDLSKPDPLEYDLVVLPGGTDLNQLADYLGVTRKSLKDLNAEILLGYIPPQVSKHPIRVPKGSYVLVGEFIEKKRLQR